MPGMRSPEDWDYAALRARLIELAKPPLVSGKSSPGAHCIYCQKDDSAVCGIVCAYNYKAVFGFEPPAES